MAKSKIQDRRAFDPGSSCPYCGSDTSVGFGLAGGGYGPYTYCETCQKVTSKSADIDDDPTSPATAVEGE